MDPMLRRSGRCRAEIAGAPPRRRSHAHDNFGTLLAWAVLVVGCCGHPHALLAATLTVSPSGAGQFTTIQAALDASAPGDSILLKNGVYTANTRRFADGAWRRAAGWIEKPVTILGEEWARVRAGTETDTWAFFSLLPDSLTFLGVWIQQMDSGIRADGHTLVRGCRFEGLARGLVTAFATGNLLIRDCAFSAMTGTGIRAVQSASVDMRRCEYAAASPVDVAVVVNGGAAAHIQNCHFQLSRVLQVQGQATGFIRDSVIDAAPVDVLRPIFPGAYIEARNLRITGKPYGNPPSIPIAIAPRERATVIGDSLVISTCYAAILAELQSHVTLRNSHILDWTNYSVWMRDYPGPEDVTLDLVGNYWGLTDSTAIAASIWDGADDRWNLPHGRASFWPALDRPVPSATRSFGELKAPYHQKGQP
jgi:hypothetical protein